ncbi:hypothetical protein M9H77_34932 [Catharanthus roseus]|uniref:Uncharacterized protein n=1 Tax=Catharanthus roseus TaxID=4058 RepID=A0ACB9ZPR1_CATRO|nr:hypothetical protein M9H77_34932 [Catharanthus roseus]
MRITQCETMEGLIDTDREEVDNDAELALFPDLERIELRDLPMLEMFASGSYYLSKWPALRKVMIADCPKWKTFDVKSIEGIRNKQFGSFFHQKVKSPSLEELYISGKVEMIRDEEHQYEALNKLREFFKGQAWKMNQKQQIQCHNIAMCYIDQEHQLLTVQLERS